MAAAATEARQLALGGDAPAQRALPLEVSAAAVSSVTARARSPPLANGRPASVRAMAAERAEASG